MFGYEPSFCHYKSPFYTNKFSSTTFFSCAQQLWLFSVMDNLPRIVNNLQQIGLKRKQQQNLSQKVVVQLSAILEQFLARVNVLIELFLALAWPRGSMPPDPHPVST
jgi:hypothetical protein